MCRWGREVRRVRLLDRRASGQRERSHRGAVVGLRGRDRAPAVGVASFDVIQPRELQRRLVRLGPAGDEPHPGHLGHEPEQAVREPFLRLAREVVVVEVRDLLRLLGRGRGDLGDAVTEAGHHRAARARVEDPPAVRRRQPHALAALDARVRQVEGAVEHGRAVGADHRGVAAEPSRATSVEVALEQPQRGPPVLLGVAVGLGEQRVRVDALARRARDGTRGPSRA